MKIHAAAREYLENRLFSIYRTTALNLVPKAIFLSLFTGHRSEVTSFSTFPKSAVPSETVRGTEGKKSGENRGRIEAKPEKETVEKWADIEARASRKRGACPRVHT